MYICILYFLLAMSERRVEGVGGEWRNGNNFKVRLFKKNLDRVCKLNSGSECYSSQRKRERERGGGGMFIGNLSIVTSSVVCWLLLRFIDSYSVVGINISKIGIIVHIKEKCTVTKSRGKILMLLICNKMYLICINTSCFAPSL